MKLQYFFLAVAVVVIAVLATAGLRGHHFTRPPFEIFPDMNYQDKVKDQQPSAFFADGNSAREPIAGTVAMEMPAANDYWATGKWDDTHWGDGIPAHEGKDGGRALAVDDIDMARGRERYNISCAVCHGAAGDGQGVVTKYGLSGVASYHTDRLRQATDGDLFNTISNGKGQMLGYGYNITIDDRWRIVMYVRALQRSQNAPLSDATPDEQAQLDKTKKAPPPAPTAAAVAPVNSSAGQPTGSQLPAPTKPPPPQNNSQPGNGAPTPPLPPASPKPPPGATFNGTHGTNRTNGTLVSYASHLSHRSHPSHPVLFLSQQTLKGWIDSDTPEEP
jgi:mono/diheme cytochrome c family protein